MRYVKRIAIIIFIAQVFVSCSLVLPIIGVNLKYKTPRRAGRYPKFTEKDSLRGSTLSKYRNNYDVTFYDLNIDIDPAKRYIKGYVDIYFTALADVDKIQIDLYDNMKIDSISHQSLVISHQLKYVRKYNAVFVSFNDIIPKGNKEKIRVYYEGTPITAHRPPWEGGFVWKEDNNKKPWVGVACEVAGASLWWPDKDVLFDRPDSMKMKFTVPEGLFCVSNGKLIDTIKSDKKESFMWKTNYPINTYDATVYIGDYKHFAIPYENGGSKFNLDFYVLPYNLEKAKSHFTQAVDILKFYESAFGAYPWSKEDYKLVEGPYEGQENQTAIAYGNGYKNGPMVKDVDYIILHESAHEWWGNSVSAKDFADCWLHEGFATYAEALYVEKNEGYNEYLKYLIVYSWFIKNKKPVIGPYNVNYWNYRDTDPYMKGALTLHTLRNMINNDSLFFKIIKTFYNQRKYSIIETKDFINVVNQMTGSDYIWFFKQYLWSRVCPRLEWNCVYNDKEKTYTLYYKWANVGNEFKLPVKIYADGHHILIYPSDSTRYLKVESLPYINTNFSYIAVKKNKHLH